MDAPVTSPAPTSGIAPGAGHGSAAAGGSLHRIDNRKMPCALGLLHVQRVMAGIPLGDVVEVVTRDRFAPYEVPAWVDRLGLELVASERSGFWLFSKATFRIRKTVEVAAPRL